MAKDKRVFYVKYVSDPLYLEIMNARPDVQLDKLENETDDVTVSAVLEAAHVYTASSSRDEVLPKFHVDAQFLARTPNLLAVSTLGAGYDTVNVSACTEAGVLACNQAGGNREAVAEHALGMMLVLTKHMIEADRFMHRANGIQRTLYMGNDLYGKTVGIIGLGNVGGRLAELCHGLFAMRVLAYDPYLSADEIKAKHAEKVELDELMRQSDYVSLNCPLSSETRGMIGARQFGLMKPTAYFVTTCRGSIHDEKALAEALAARKIAGAGLDVWDKEPPDMDNPLLKFDNVLATPHTAGVTKEARLTMARYAAEQVLDILDGKRPPRLLNPEAWPAFVKRYERIFGVRPNG
jgi:D-3-phosphoglycerate dehydrogenase